MTDRISVDTARKLAAAGWQHTLEPGDWVWVAGGIRLARWVVSGGCVNADGVSYAPADCLHLPTAEQLLEALAGTSAYLTVDKLRGAAWQVRWYALEGDARQWDEHESLAEAAALAWLASHVEGTNE